MNRLFRVRGSIELSALVMLVNAWLDTVEKGEDVSMEDKLGSGRHWWTVP
jgi:hypothetical protein